MTDQGRLDPDFRAWNVWDMYEVGNLDSNSQATRHTRGTILLMRFRPEIELSNYGAQLTDIKPAELEIHVRCRELFECIGRRNCPVFFFFTVFGKLLKLLVNSAPEPIKKKR